MCSHWLQAHTAALTTHPLVILSMKHLPYVYPPPPSYSYHPRGPTQANWTACANDNNAAMVECTLMQAAIHDG